MTGMTRHVRHSETAAATKQTDTGIAKTSSAANFGLDSSATGVPVFSGDPTEYSDFIRAFENLIKSKTSDPSMKLHYLVQYIAGDVRQLMRGCLPMKPEEGYETARSLLKNRFGQGYKIATAYVERLTKIQPVASEDASALQRFLVMLTHCKNALKEIGYQSKIENPDTMQKIVERLPFGLRQKWREKADSITEGKKREVSIEDIADFVEAKARVAHHPVFGNVTNISRNFVEKNDATRRNRNPRLKVSQGTYLATQGNLPDDKTERVDGAQNVVSVNPNLKCPLCEANHWLPVVICLKESLTKIQVCA